MPEYDSTIEYRDIPGIPGYCVGNNGTVWSCWIFRRRKRVLSECWKEMLQRTNRQGYRSIRLTTPKGRQSFFVHRLVLMVFVGEKPADKECRHFPDPTKSNNHVTNLSWATRLQNVADNLASGVQVHGVRSPASKLCENSVKAIRARYASGNTSHRKLGKEFGVSHCTIERILKHRKWKHVV